jgi:hypothetical protein
LRKVLKFGLLGARESWYVFKVSLIRLIIQELDMRGFNGFLGSIALAGMMIVFPVQAGAATMDQSSDGLCRVKVSRSASDGVYDVTRLSLSNGKCVCRVTTGRSSQGGSAESALASLLLRRTCDDAPLAAARAAGGLSTAALIGGAVLVGGGLAVALASGGSSKPKSP